MKAILIIVRAEGDFERAISIGLKGQDTFKVCFVFVGDFSPFFEDGIQNEFQKNLFQRSHFNMLDFSDFDIGGRVLKKLCGGRVVNFENVRENSIKLFQYVLFAIFKQYINKRRNRIINKIFNRIKPSLLFTDQSLTNRDYLPEQIRNESFTRDIPVYIFTHGAAGGLHCQFSEPTFNPYNNYTVLACNESETSPDFTNRIIIGDPSSSYPYVHFLNQQKYNEITFLDSRKFKVAFLVGGVIQAFTSTNAWSNQEEIIIELSDREDVAMILKLHPREARFMDLRMLRKFKNLRIVGSETDRSRVTKWANIVICNDHTSVIFEPMILGKKVVAIEGKHIPKYKNYHSPLRESSVQFISNSSEFNLNLIPAADPADKVTNEIAWGGNGQVDLADLLFSKIL